jgi:hypothetical protein
LESIKWEAKMVLIRVDFPRPVWPIVKVKGTVNASSFNEQLDNFRPRTNTHHIELKATLQELPLNLRCDAVKTNVAAREDSGRVGRVRISCGRHGESCYLVGYDFQIKSGIEQWEVEYSDADRPR